MTGTQQLPAASSLPPANSQLQRRCDGGGATAVHRSNRNPGEGLVGGHARRISSSTAPEIVKPSSSAATGKRE